MVGDAIQMQLVATKDKFIGRVLFHEIKDATPSWFMPERVVSIVHINDALNLIGHLIS
jgi:hypothetical protein